MSPLRKDLNLPTHMKEDVEDRMENDNVSVEGSFGGLLLLLDMFLLIVHKLIVLVGHSDTRRRKWEKVGIV